MLRELSVYGLSLVLVVGLLGGCGDDDGGNNNQSQAVCGDGRTEGAESCDGSDLGGESCASLGFFGGTLSCAASCAFNTSLCEPDWCGNDVAGTEEECDGVDLRFATCESEGFAGGQMACDADCELDLSGCLAVYCGSGAIEGSEACDGNDLGGEDCESQGYDLGTLACLTDCTAFDIMGCYYSTCGNDTIEGNEDCDGVSLGGATCQSLGQDGGTLVCTNCHYDLSGCWTQVCGDDVVQPGEVCDGTDLDGETCQSQSFDGGTLACLGDCSGFDTSGCMNQGTGESCSDLYTVQTFPHTADGTDITVDFADDHDFTGTGCGTGNGAEAVFAVDLTAGEQIKLDQVGGLDAVIRVLDTCDATADCLLSSDTPEIDLFFTAPATGTYYVVLEAWSSSPVTTDYDFTITLVPPEDCGDGVDNDLDGAVDCGDPDCFGDPTDCATETLCNDGLDNDAEGGTDCADADCSALPICGGGTQVFFENFSTVDATGVFVGWTITDGGSTADTWMQCDTGTTPGCDEGEFGSATGPFALVNSDAAGAGSTCLEELASPAIDCSGYTNVALTFLHNFQASFGDMGEVLISINGGANWTSVYTIDTDTGTAGETVTLDISALATGQADVRIAFVYTADYDWWWMIDDVEVRAL